MNSTQKLRRLVPLAVGGMALALASQAGLTQNGPEFEVAQIFLELNDTDGDLGIHGLIDGEAWKSLEIEGPGELELMNVWLRSGLRRQGLTEFFFESAEPPFDELSPAAFLNRFKQGIYEIEAVTLDNVEFEEEVRLSHVLAGPPQNVRVNGKRGAANCDGDLPVVSAPVTINWAPVTMSHPTIGKPNVAGQSDAVPVRLRDRARRQGSGGDRVFCRFATGQDTIHMSGGIYVIVPGWRSEIRDHHEARQQQSDGH